MNFAACSTFVSAVSKHRGSHAAWECPRPHAATEPTRQVDDLQRSNQTKFAAHSLLMEFFTSRQLSHCVAPRHLVLGPACTHPQ